MDYQAQIDEMKQILNNIALHLNYNHPVEAEKMLTSLVQKAQDLKDEIAE